MPPTPKIRGKTTVNNLRTFFEGFRPNGLQIRNQRIILSLVACVKIDFGEHWKNFLFFVLDLSGPEKRPLFSSLRYSFGFKKCVFYAYFVFFL